MKPPTKDEWERIVRTLLHGKYVNDPGNKLKYRDFEHFYKSQLEGHLALIRRL